MNYVSETDSLLLVEQGTGTIFGVADPGDVVKVISKEQLEARRKMEQHSVPLNTGRKFIKQFPDLSARLCERLSPNAVWLLCTLTPYIGMNSGILRFRNGQFLKRVDIWRICEGSMPERTADRAVTELCVRGVLAKCTVENRRAFLVNPYVMQNGSRANATLLTLFQDTEWAHG